MIYDINLESDELALEFIETTRVMLLLGWVVT